MTPRARQRFRTVFISDVHLGTPQSQAEALISFLGEVQTEQLFLVGDIVDGWKLQHTWFWPESHTAVLSSILSLGKAGTRIVYVPGNHDEALRPFLREGVRLGNLELQLEALHTTASGQRMLVLHGDRCDTSVHLGSAWTRFLGDWLYDVFVQLNILIKGLRRALGLPYWSLAGAVHSNSRFAKGLVQRYELALIAEAQRRGVDGVVCGHIHAPRIRREGPLTYANTGDWVDSCSALVEDAAGELSLLHWMPRHEELQGLGRASSTSSSGSAATRSGGKSPRRPARQGRPRGQAAAAAPALKPRPGQLAESDLIQLVQLLSQGEGHTVPEALIAKLARSTWQAGARGVLQERL